MRPLACLTLLALAPLPVHALATEQLGNKPIANGFGWSEAMLKAVNVECRVYWYEVNGNPCFYFKGSPKEMNEAIRHFAAIRWEKKEIRLLAGPGKRTTLGGETPVAYDWELHVPGGLSAKEDDTATLTIHIDTLAPAAPADPAKLREWIKLLGSDDFKTRDKAEKELDGAGRSALAMLRPAVKAAETAEARERLERLIAKSCDQIRVDTLVIPEGFRIVCVETMAEAAAERLADKDAGIRGRSIATLCDGLLPTVEAIAELKKFLANEKHEYALRCATGVAYRMGDAAKPLLPALRELLKSEDKNVAASSKQAIEQIEKSKPTTVDDAEAKRLSALRKEIAAYCKARS